MLTKNVKFATIIYKKTHVCCWIKNCEEKKYLKNNGIEEEIIETLKQKQNIPIIFYTIDKVFLIV